MEQSQTAGENQFWTPRRVFLATLTVIGVALGFLLLFRFGLVLFSLFEAIVFSTAISSPVNWLEKRKIPRAFGIVLVFLVIIAIIFAFLLFAIPLIVDQGATLISTLSKAYQSFYISLANSSSFFLQRIALWVPPTINLNPPVSPSGDGSLRSVTQAINYIKGFGNGLFTVFAVLLLTYYYTVDREIILKSFLLLAPKSRRDDFRSIIETTESRVGAYIRGLAILSLSIGVMAFLAYTLIGLPHAPLLGIIAGVMEVVPIIGPFLGAVPAVLVALSNDPTKIAYVIVAYTAIQFSESHFLVPRIMNKTVGVNPVVSLLALAALSALFGIAGALLAIPLAVLFQILFENLLLDPSLMVQEPPRGRDEVSALRYETQEMIVDVRKLVRVKEGELPASADEIEDQLETVITDLDSILAKAEDVNNGDKQ